MFSLAYVILPFSDISPAEAIAASLARFRQGGPGDVPDEWLRFQDYTAEVRAAHETLFTFERISERGLRIEGGLHWLLDIEPIIGAMETRGKERWTVRLADVESNLASFARHFVRGLERHPVTGGFGVWRNGLGRWDWWELGGRFDGLITGTSRQPGRRRSRVSSGLSTRRAMLESIEDALIDAFDQDAPAEIDVHADNNVEMVSRLIDDLRSANKATRRPGAIVLPPGSTDDALRWIGTWPKIAPIETADALGLPADTSWQEIEDAVYERFSDHWAAGVAYHH